MKKKEKIYNKAMELFREKSYEDVTIEDICHGCGVSVGIFYYHFKSKEAFISLVHKNSDELLERDFSKQSFDRHFDAIFYIIKWLFQYAENNGLNGITVLYQTQIIQSERYATNSDRFLFKKLQELILSGIESKEFYTSLRPDDIVNRILRTVRGVVYDWCLHDGSFDLTKIGLEDVTIVLSALLEKPKRKHRSEKE